MKCSIIFLLIILLFSLSCQSDDGLYVCPPCDQFCDKLTFSAKGICPHCNMKLVKTGTNSKEEMLVLNDINLDAGSGMFLISGGKSNEEKAIIVFYHKPKNYNSKSKVLLVIPGAGRNGNSYRDAWVDKSEKYNVLILAPLYLEKDYRFEDYHLCGLVKNTNIESSIEKISGTNIARLNEDNLEFEINQNSGEWLFSDFDRIFNLVANNLKSTQNTYDIFGHSAGGHILHRLALFNKSSKADRIIACNTSFYTCPSEEYAFPFGLKNLKLKEGLLQNAFKKKLVIFLGEMDNEKETKGTFLRSKTADQQGLHRLARGKHFFKISKEIAFGDEFNWQMKIVPNVGHDHQLIGDAVGEYLYGNI